MKSTRDLGLKEMDRRIKLADPGITAGDEQAVLAALRSGQLVMGQAGRGLAAALARLTGRSHAIPVSSGTAALHAVMHALGVGPGSTVIVPALTFPAPASVAAHLGATVRLCDVDKTTFNLSPATLEPVLDDRVCLVVAIDQFGVPAPVAELLNLLRPRGISLIVDAACSIGAAYSGDAPCGALGLAATFSFHPRKVITAAEGGAVLTDDPLLAAQVRRLINHGLEDGSFADIGLNLRLSELGAALALSQLQRLPELVAHRAALAARYQAALPLAFQRPLAGAQPNHQTLAALLPEPLGPTERSALFASLREQGIEANLASYCLAAVPTLAARFATDQPPLPNAHAIHNRGIALPLHSGLGPAEVDYVVTAVHNWLSQHTR